MSQKPAALIYGVDDTPPLSATCLLAVQHIFLMSSTLVLPVILVTELGGSFAQVQSVVALTMVACGIGTSCRRCAGRVSVPAIFVQTSAARISSRPR